MLGYDLPRLHAALNDLPAALLLVSVLFDLLGALLKRDSLRAAGFWTLLAGVVGTAAAVLSGKLAEEAVEHSDEAHAIMETHETLGVIVLVLFTLLLVWRLVRRGVLGPREVPVALTAGVIGVALMVYTAGLGAKLMFDHGIGIPAGRMEAVIGERGGGAHEHAGGDSHEHAPDSAAGDSAGAAADSAHTHADGTSHTHN
jgi:uncharacterized membrane protein